MTSIKKLIPTPLKSLFKYLLGVAAFDPAFIAAHGLNGTVDHLENKYWLYKPALIRFLMTFYRTLMKLEADIPLYPNENLLIIHCCCWGRSYTEKMLDCFFTSLLSKNNLPNIAEKYKIMLLIHGDQSTKQAVFQSPISEELKKYAVLHFITLPDDILSASSRLNFLESFLLRKTNFIDTFKYILLGGLQTHALKIALKNKAYISFMVPDVLLSDAFFSEMIADAEDKPFVLSTTFRTNYQKIQKNIAGFYDNPERTVLSIPAAKLTELQIETIHEAAKRRIIAEDTINFYASAQLIFKTQHGLLVRALHYHPILVNCAHLDPAIQMDYFPIDNSMLNRMVSDDIPYDQQVCICHDKTKVAWVELSDDHIEENYLSSQPISYSELVTKVKTMISRQPEIFDTPLNRYFFSVRNEMYSSKINDHQVHIDDRQFARELEKAIL